MAIEGISDVVIPSSPADRDKLREMLLEMVGCLRRSDDERVAKKEIADEIKEKFKIPPKISNRAAKTILKANLAEQQTEFDQFNEFFDVIIQGGDGESE